MASSVPNVKLSNGLKMPMLGLGTWNSKPEKLTQAVETAIDVGYRHFDCAYVYQNEKEVGVGIHNKINEGVITREDVWVTSKLWNTYHPQHMVEPSLRKSLENFKIDYLDLYLIHWPMAYKEGNELFPADKAGKVIYSNTHFKETWKGMEECLQKGLTKAIGISNFNSVQITELLKSCTIKPVVNQIECHPYLNQDKLSAFCKERGIVITAYGPLGSPDAPWVKPTDKQLLASDKLKHIGLKYHKTVAQTLIRYQIEKGHVVIPKSMTKSRIQENFKIFDFKLNENDLELIDKMNCNKRVCHLNWVKDHPLYPFNIEF